MTPEYDVVVIGGGPAGSNAARLLAGAGARVAVLDAARFPRVKLCAGWVTRRVWQELELDPDEYPRTLQPFSRATLELADGAAETRWPGIASYGIVRSEFDDFLLRRAQAAGATIREETRARAVTRRAGGFSVETDRGTVCSAIVIGAGGHLCPAARAFGQTSPREAVVVTRESESRLGQDRLAGIAPRPGVPELFPEEDFRGYGWYFTKGDFLNVGLGALDHGRGINARTARFVERLRKSGRLPGDLPLVPFRGHAYAVRVLAPRRVAAPGVFLAGDAAGLARPVSGEGIGPAVESGALAARSACRVLGGEGIGRVAADYERAVAARFGDASPRWWARIWSALPGSAAAALPRLVCRSDRLRRRLVFEGAFGMG